MERDQFLRRVAAAIGGGSLPPTPRPPPPASTSIRCDDLVDTFALHAAAVAAAVSRGNADEALAAVDGVFFASDQRSYLGWADLDDFLPGVTRHLATSGREPVDPFVGHDSAARNADHRRLGNVAVGITGADVAIAASGSVVLQHGPGRPRSASLLVEHHIVLLPVNRIVASLEESLQRVDLAGTSNVVAITGPSRTGDIDSVLTLGVHGPRHIHIVIVE